MSVNSKMTAIANAIRAKTGTSGTLTLDQMVTAIASIEAGDGKSVTSVDCTTLASNGKFIGDINNDGVIDSTDEELAGEIMANGDYDAAADLDGDGTIGIEDMIYLSNLIATKGEDQIIAKVTITYNDQTSSTVFIPVDAPAVSSDGKTITSVTCSSKTSNGVFFGDVNNDGKIDSTDVNLVASYDVGSATEIDFEAADVNGDGEISTADMVELSGAVENNKIFVKITIAYNDGTTKSYMASVDVPESGIDTSDATATAPRILAPYTAYSNGEKITGTMKDKSGTTQHTAGASSDAISTGIRLAIPEAGYYSTANRIFYSNSNLANAIGLTAEKLAKGNTVIGVVGTAESGGGGGGNIDGIIDGTVKSLVSDTLTSIRAYAFYGIENIETINFSAVRSMGQRAFYNCTGLKNVSLPLLGTLPDYAFRGCENLEEIVLNVTRLQTYGFQNCTALKKVVLAKATSISYYNFQGCSALEALIIDTDGVCTLDANNFANSGIANGTGFVYVPLKWLNGYKSESNWSAIANQIRAKEDYPEIIGG